MARIMDGPTRCHDAMNPQELRGLTGLVALYATRMLGLFMVLPVLALEAEHYRGVSPALVGVALGAYGLTQGLLQIPLGLLSDRVGRRVVIAGGMAVFCAGSVLAAMTESIHGLILGRALQGAGAVASAVMALLADLTTEEHRTRAMAAVGGSIGLAFAAAMVLGPLLAAHWGLAAIFWLTALLAALGIALVVFWIPAPAAPSRLAASESLAVPRLLGRVLSHGQLLRLDFGVFALHLAQMASWVAVPTLLAERHHLPLERHWLFYLAAMGGGFFLMIPLVIHGERRGRLKPVLLFGIAALMAGDGLLAMAGERFFLFAAGALAFFVGFNLLEAVLPSLVSKIAPAGTRGTAMGVFSSSQFLGAFAGGALGGLVAHGSGLEDVFWLAAAVAALWLGVAATMAPPPNWGTVVVDLAEYPAAAAVERLRECCKGVEEITLFPEERLLYLKVDKSRFSREELDALLREGAAGRP
ncbi:MAG: MFS transporter [Porticoccaceae bacterium]|nr:MAG: MFS transporter [Porticoccaceae bacterium]